MQVDYIVVGQGLCGSWLSYWLQQAGQSFIVIDAHVPNTASRVASGIINPVTGRRIVKTWMIDVLMPFAWQAYTSFGQQLGIDCISEKAIIDCFTTPQMRLAFLDRYANDQQFLSLPQDERDWQQWIRYDFGYGVVQPAYLVNMPAFMDAVRKKLIAQNLLRDEQLEFSRLAITDSAITYQDITAKKIIFCDGAAGFDNPFFPSLPYGLNKGERLLVQIPGFPSSNIIKKGYTLSPWSADLFWLGSTYLWEFDDASPTKGFYQFADNWLKQNICADYTIIDHTASVRPATLERKPFVGLHPGNENIGILNGMGTKGCSLAPYFAKQLTDHLLHDTPLQPDADVQRFKRILDKRSGN